MMGFNANNLLADLHTVNELAAKYLENGNLSFDEKLRLMYFFKDYGDIGSMFVQDEVNLSDISDSSIKPETTRGILEEARMFLDLYKDNKNSLDEFEVKTDCDNYLAPLILKWEMSDEHSQKVHHDYLILDHRLDYMGEGDPDYEELKTKCYELFDKQKEASKIAQQAKMELEKARHKLYGLENFNLKWLFLLVGQISDTIMDIFPNIEDVKTEEDV